MAFPSQLRKPEAPQPGDVLVVVHDFDARSTDELTLRKADRVELVELDEDFGDGWYLGRHLGREATGLFPGVYTAKLPPNISAVAAAAQPYAHTPQIVHELPEPSPTGSTQPSEAIPTPYQHFADLPRADRAMSQNGASLHTRSGSYGSRSSMPPPSTYKPMVQRSIGEALSARGGSGEESPVMNETLSVIDEHITDLSTPRQSLQPAQRSHDDSESEYSSHLDRISFLAGPETEDEDSAGLTNEEVLQWDHKETANHLRSLGVDPSHCDIFEEQEITGEVLLEMDQSFIQMKEFDFGVMGRRLKTWHKIRDFQRDVRGRNLSHKSSLNTGSSLDDSNRSPNRTTSGTAILPRIPSLHDNHGLSIRQSQHTNTKAGLPLPLQTLAANSQQRTSLGADASPSAWRSSLGPDSPSRLTAARNKDSRRHSSIDFGQQPDLTFSSVSLGSASTPNKHKASFERDWLSGESTPGSTNITVPSMDSKTLRKQDSFDMSANSPLMGNTPTLDLDRGYFSGNEVDNRKARNVLRKSFGSPGHSRQSSLLDDKQKTGPSVKRHSRLSSVDSSRDPGPLLTPASKAYHSSSYKGRFRSASARGAPPKLSPRGQSPGGHSPTVTNLEEEHLSRTAAGGSSQMKMNIPAKARKLMGLRAASEAVTPIEKANATSSKIISEPLEESPAASPDGSHTPSIAGQSIEVDNTDSSTRGTEHPGSIMGASSQRSRPKTKHQTSAYAKGLLKLSPEEARKECDYHGWMKKKSSSLVTGWKPRLFILRGRRLSYYYTETDTEERGIIDISGHKVLVANSDPMIALHATITGAKASPSSAGGNSSESSPNVSKALNSSQGGPFYFKLVPPKAGLSRAVQFTKPTIHYFQTDTATEGRKWMGEIMKATIEHDLTSFETTNKQKTISLAKAKARKERPPALKETANPTIVEDAEAVLGEKSKARESGLNIKGVVGLGGDEVKGDAKADTENIEPPPPIYTKTGEETTTA